MQGGDAICSCTHLTDFIVFEFPTSAAALLDTLVAATKVNDITLRAWECLADPDRSWHNVREAWLLSIFMIVMLVVLMYFAVKRDREELSLVLGLLAGKKRDEMKKQLIN